jgi:hypothetical protein
MNSNSKFQKSISDEFLAIKDRVEYFISHNAENGRYREIILMNYLKKILPINVKVGTGFVRKSETEVTKQIDIIVYDANYPTFFEEGDFVVLLPESVLGIIEVKSNATTTIINDAIEKASYNGKIVGRKNIFNGIFSYKTNMDFHRNFRDDQIGTSLLSSQGFVNHIAFDARFFMRFWEEGNPVLRRRINKPCYSFYDLSLSNISNEHSESFGGLAFGYFISNLLEVILKHVNQEGLSDQYYDFLYPLENTKESYRMDDREIFVE